LIPIRLCSPAYREKGEPKGLKQLVYMSCLEAAQEKAIGLATFPSIRGKCEQATIIYRYFVLFIKGAATSIKLE
ncbi:MAG: hypothetical protein KIS95_07325, partial [Anaerolineae bacterium]|nr:hypothetical protein [Anaerolineae bacterium]